MHRLLGLLFSLAPIGFLLRENSRAKSFVQKSRTSKPGNAAWHQIRAFCVAAVVARVPCKLHHEIHGLRSINETMCLEIPELIRIYPHDCLYYYGLYFTLVSKSQTLTYLCLCQENGTWGTHGQKRVNAQNKKSGRGSRYAKYAF